MIMTICTSTFMPYEGFDLPLAILTFPIAILSAIVLGRKYISVESIKELVDEDLRDNKILSGKRILVQFIPLILMVILMILPRIWPFIFPDPGMALVFVICGIVALFTGVKRINFWQQSLATFNQAFTVMVLFIGMGIFVHFLSLIGGKGFLAAITVSLPKWALYISSAIMPVVLGGPIVPFGTAAILGPPIVLAFSAQNSIILSSGLSFFLSLGCLGPPTALSSLFAAQIVGMKNYLEVTKRCWKLALFTGIYWFSSYVICKSYSPHFGFIEIIIFKK
jgi:hypothetical protein